MSPEHDRRQGQHGGGQGRQGRNDDGPPFQLTTEAVGEILSGNGEKIVHWAEKLAEKLKRLHRAQVRNFYNPLIRLRESAKPDDEKISRLHLMRARLKYMVAREDKARPLQEAFEKLIPAVKNKENLSCLYDFAEAVVAYHRSLGG